jgi:DNA-directed RNA polymerase subunit beta'
LIYQKLKTGDIIQGIPKVEQFFEARTTKRGRLFRDNLPNLLKGLFLKYYFSSFQLLKQGFSYNPNLIAKKRLFAASLAPSVSIFSPPPTGQGGKSALQQGSQKTTKIFAPKNSKMDYAFIALQWAVQQSFYKIQQIAVDGVLRVYRSQGVTISDKHLEIIVKQMTTKVRVIQGGQTGFFPGEIVDLDLVETLNIVLLKKIHYEPIILGITKASLQVDSFLSSASFQQTSRILTQSALFNRKDFLKGVKENVILGNLIPAGTGYLVSLDSNSIK